MQFYDTGVGRDEGRDIANERLDPIVVPWRRQVRDHLAPAVEDTSQQSALIAEVTQHSASVIPI
ncbi:hypothetical protein [Herbiconiux liukaitaii]|uniref:hypothetical protein n=1 Tax=Herbiconiux liukaitaii TaxID=3342799 RepID=UPI0035BA7608